MTGNFHYRREIDGLRAMAVIPVILFHAGFDSFAGGFVGVDIFFVISGYLITSIILADLDERRFSLTEFYERRARRILPALFLVMGVCVPFAWAWLPPDELHDFAQSVAAVSLFSSNILFWRESGYFDTVAELKPLLHTWSLGVEEQFYLLFPLFMMAAWRIGKSRLAVVLAAVALCSLALSHWGALNKPAASFFLLPTRAWELLLGSLVALRLPSSNRFQGKHVMHEFACMAAMCMLLFPIFLYSKATPFPGLYALAPALGTALLIVFATQHTVVGRVLGARPLVGLGLISYSAYLWHQPILSFARNRAINQIPASVICALCLLCLMLAWLTWKYVEQPFRDRQRMSRRRVGTMAVSFGTGFLFLGIAGHLLDGRVPGGQTSHHQTTYRKSDLPRCGLKDVHLNANCRFLGAEGTPPSVLLVGDSHAQAISSELSRTLAVNGLAGYAITMGGCTPIRNVAIDDPSVFDTCIRLNRAISDQYLYDHAASPIDTVILMSRWTAHWTGTGFDNGEGGREVLGLGEEARLKGLRGGEATYDKAQIAQLFRDHLENIKASTVILVYPVPEVGWNVPKFLRIYADEVASTYSTAHSRYVDRNREIDEVLDGLEAEVFRVRPSHIFCDTFVRDRCVFGLGGEALYVDDDHLSDLGARFLIGNIVPILTVDRREGQAH